MRTSFHHQPEAQHPNFQLSTSWQADYPIFRGTNRKTFAQSELFQFRIPKRSYRKASLTLDDVGCNDPLPDDEHIRVVRIDADLDPMVVGGAESFKPGEVFDRRTDRRALNSCGERLVSPEEVTVAVDQDDRLSERNSAQTARHLTWRSAVEEPNHRHRRVLRAPRAATPWPCRRAA
jgi:hypothetical protein